MQTSEKLSVAIMQPYFFPYIGYFQLIEAADVFVVYDDVKYTKKGWINRNRYLLNGSDAIFSLPLKKDSDFLNVVERQLADDFNRPKLLRQLRSAYSKAPYFEQTYPLLEKIISFENNNLFEYIYNSIIKICEHLNIRTRIIKSSLIDINHRLKNKDKVVAICKSLEAGIYINPIGGVDLYSKNEFLENGLTLKFIKSRPISYKQYQNEFVPWLSIIDVLMFNAIETANQWIAEEYDFV